MNECKADWYISIDFGDNKGRDGEYLLTSVGCGCCAGYDRVSKEEYIKILKDMKNLIEKEIENETV